MTNLNPLVFPFKDYEDWLEAQLADSFTSGRGLQMRTLITTMLSGQIPKSREEAGELATEVYSDLTTSWRSSQVVDCPSGSVT